MEKMLPVCSTYCSSISYDVVKEITAALMMSAVKKTIKKLFGNESADIHYTS